MPDDLLTRDVLPVAQDMRQANEVATTEQDALPAVQEQTPPAVPAVAEPQSIPERILSLAAHAGVDKDIFDRLVAWQEREADAQAMERFNAAMAAAQAEIQPVARSAENKQTNSFYAKLEAVDGAIRPIYLKHGFNVRYNTVPPLTAGNIRVECVVSLGRHKEAFYREAPADTLGPKGSAVKTILHGGGSTETYLKRYAVCGAFNVVFRSLQDDDGNRGGMKFIDSDQVAELVDLCKRGGREESTFLGTMVTDCHRFEEVETRDFVRLANTLRVMAERREAAQSKGQADAA